MTSATEYAALETGFGYNWLAVITKLQHKARSDASNECDI